MKKLRKLISTLKTWKFSPNYKVRDENEVSNYRPLTLKTVGKVYVWPFYDLIYRLNKNLAIWFEANKVCYNANTSTDFSKTF